MELTLGLTAAAALIAAGAWLLPFGDTKVIVSDPPARGSATGKPDDLLDEIAQRPMWTEPPQMFSSANGLLEKDGDPTVAVDYLYAEYPAVSVVDSRDLVDNAGAWDGDVLYLVGRVVRVRRPKSSFGLNVEYQLAVHDGTNAYVAVNGSAGISGGAEGDVVHVLGQLAAVGSTREIGEPERSTAYFVAYGPYTTPQSYDPAISTVDSRALESGLAAAAKDR